MAEEPVAVLLRVFTHPACAGCAGVVDRAWKLTQKRSGVDLRTVNLVNEDGLAEARSEGVNTIPSVILSAGGSELKRWTGTPENGALEAAVDELSRVGPPSGAESRWPPFGGRANTA